MPVKVVTTVPSWAKVATSFYQLKVNINAPGGGITEVYNFDPSMDFGDIMPIVPYLLEFRNDILARNADIVNAVLTRKYPVGQSQVNGFRVPPDYYGQGDQLLYVASGSATVQANFAVTNTAGALSITSPPVPGGYYPTYPNGTFPPYVIWRGVYDRGVFYGNREQWGHHGHYAGIGWHGVRRSPHRVVAGSA